MNLSPKLTLHRLFCAEIVEYSWFIWAFSMRTAACCDSKKCRLELWEWVKAKLRVVKTKTMSWKTLKRSVGPMRTKESGDNYLWVCSYEQPLPHSVIWFIVNINIMIIGFLMSFQSLIHRLIYLKRLLWVQSLTVCHIKYWNGLSLRKL